jgi:hypothetical protein
VTDTLTEFERELLDAVGIGGSRFGVATDSLDEELLETSPGRAVVEETLRRLDARGLVRSERSWGSLTLRPRDGTHSLSEADKRPTVHRAYEGDWWIITDAGWAALGVPPPTSVESWMNPSSGQWSVSLQRLVAARARLMSLAALGFIAAIYIHEQWLEVAIVAIAIACLSAALGGYALRWRQRKPPASN